MKTVKSKAHWRGHEPRRRASKCKQCFPEPPLTDTAVEDLLEACRAAYHAGFRLVLYEVLCICAEHKYPVPGWAVSPIRDLMDLAVAGGLSKPAGRTASPESQIRESVKHYARWLAMTIVKMNHGYEISDKKASIKAQELLEGTISYAADRTIRVSYKSIENRIKDYGQSYIERIYLAVERTADRLGLLNW